MLKHEFLELTKKTDDQVSDIDYARIEALYNELDDMSKQEFCRLYTDDIPNLLSVAARIIQDLRWSIAQLKDDKKKSRVLYPRESSLTIGNSALPTRSEECLIIKRQKNGWGSCKEPSLTNLKATAVKLTSAGPAVALPL